MELTRDQKKYKETLWIVARTMYPEDRRAQALYVLSGLQKFNADMYHEFLRDEENFPEFADQMIDRQAEKKLILENQGNWHKMFA